MTDVVLFNDCGREIARERVTQDVTMDTIIAGWSIQAGDRIELVDIESEEIIDTKKYKNPKVCDNCKKLYEREDMNFTTDCHGIPFRLVCYKCYPKLMAKGYDGEYYTEADECIDEDY